MQCLCWIIRPRPSSPFPSVQLTVPVRYQPETHGSGIIQQRTQLLVKSRSGRYDDIRSPCMTFIIFRLSRSSPVQTFASGVLRTDPLRCNHATSFQRTWKHYKLRACLLLCEEIVHCANLDSSGIRTHPWYYLDSVMDFIYIVLLCSEGASSDRTLMPVKNFWYTGSS